MRPRRHSLVHVALSVCALGVGAARVPAQEASEWVEGYFELYVEGVPRHPTIVALVEEDRVLVPLGQILLLTEIPLHYDGSQRVLEWPPEVWKTTLDADRRTIAIDDRVIAVAEDAWVERDGETFLGVTPLGLVLASSVRVDMARLIISVLDGPEFPAVRRGEAELRRSIERARAQLFDPERYDGVSYPARSGAGAAGWSVSVNESGGQTQAMAHPTIGAGVLGGSAELGFTSFFADGGGARVDDVLARYQRVFPENDQVRQLNLGTFASNGVIARPIIGASISNEPWITPRYFEETAVVPPVPSGWEYEVYQGGRLVGVSSPDAPGPIQAPLNYGTTPVRVRMMGPAGQERIQELVYYVPSSQIPDRQTRYTMGGGVCDGFGCEAYAFLEVGHGLSRRWTAYAGADYLTRPDEIQLQPYARVGFAATGSLNLGLQARGNSYVRTDVQHYWGRGSNLRAAYSWTRQGGGVVGAPGWVGQLSASTPLPSSGGRWLHTRLFLRGWEAERLDGWQGAAYTNFGLTTLGLEVESGLQLATITTARAQQTLIGGLPWSIEHLSLGGALGLTGRGIELVEVGGTMRSRSGAVFDAILRSRRGFEPTLVLGVTVQSSLGFFRGRTTSGRPNAFFLGADGGVVYDRDVGVTPIKFQTGVGRGGVTGDVFYDLNGDGVRGADEPPVEGAVVIVEGWRAQTDGHGRFAVWDLTPYEGVSVELDLRSIDPEWELSDTDLRLRPSPNVFSRVSIPLRRTREVIGSVFAARGSSGTPAVLRVPVAGAGVEVVDLDTGEVVFSDRTFSDGVFYATRIGPGRYRLRLAAPTAAALGLKKAPEVVFDVPAESGPPIELAPLLLPRRD